MDQYLKIMKERKEMAWLRFKNSGYRDKHSFIDFLYLYDEVKKYHYSIKSIT